MTTLSHNSKLFTFFSFLAFERQKEIDISANRANPGEGYLAHIVQYEYEILHCCLIHDDEDILITKAVAIVNKKRF